MVPAPGAGMDIPHQKPEEALTSKMGRDAGERPFPMRGEPADPGAPHGAARRSFGRQIDCTGWDAARGVARGGHQPPPRTPNGRNSRGGGRAA